MQVIKRDGRILNFEREKIVNAITNAFKEVDGQDLSEATISKIESVADAIEKKCESKNLSVEEIQDLVEEKLMASNRKDVAKTYILYRANRSKIRERKSELRKKIKEKLSASNVQNQNANIDEYSFGGRVGEASEELQKELALDEYVSEMARSNHINNEIYIHDLGSFPIGNHNCLTIPFDKLLSEGFNTRQTDVRPANSISTAFQLVAVIFQLQSLQQFGGVSASHIDWTMIPYVRKSFYKHYKDGLKYLEDFDTEHLEIGSNATSIENDVYKSYPKVYKYAMDLTVRECNQAVEAMFHNLNTLQSRSGNQLPFTSINYGTCTLPEGRMVIKALLEGSIKGVGKLHKTSVFPCSIFQCMKGVNRKEGDPNYDLYQLAIQSTAKRLYPNYANVDWSVNKGYDRDDPKTYMSTMGCRTYNGSDMNADEGVNPQTKDGRGNICPVTIIMPTLAMESKINLVEGEDLVECFMSLLDQKIYEAKVMLEERFNWICSQSPNSAKFMYENGVMLGYDGKTVFSAMKHGTLAIGQIGLAETLQILIGTDQTTDEGMALAKKIESLFNTRCAEFKHELHHTEEWGDYYLNYGVYMTPAENLCYTAMKKFQARFGTIPNVSDKDFFTNSIHVPVWKYMSPFDKIDLESQLTGYSNAGCITYVELEDKTRENLEAVQAVVDYAMDKDIPYFAINIPCDTCMNCGYSGEIKQDHCPKCQGKFIQRLRRVTGYLTGNYTTAFNKGKQQEVEMRVKHL